MAETILTDVHANLIGGAIMCEGGFITPPEAPGLGIAVNEALARAHPFTGTGLHLQMQEAPCDYRDENVFGGGAPPGT